MFDCSFGACHRLLILVAFSAICAVLAEAVLASGTEQDEAVRSWSSVGAHSQAGQQEKSGAAVTFSSANMGGRESKSKQSSFRHIRSTDVSRTLAYPALFPINRCGIVERIDPVVLNSTNNGYANTMIMGTVAIPVGRRGATFFTEIATPGSSGYIPPQRNIAEPVHYQISLVANDGNHYVITQQIPPQFGLGEAVRFNRNGFLEKSDCVMLELEQIRLGK